jgi:hypothetical protein
MTDSQTNDLEKIQGTWKQIASERDGVKEPLDEQGWEPRVTFSGNMLVVTLADGNGDGSTTPFDYNIWKTNFGHRAGDGALAAVRLEMGQRRQTIVKATHERSSDRCG